MKELRPGRLRHEKSDSTQTNAYIVIFPGRNSPIQFHMRKSMFDMLSHESIHLLNREIMFYAYVVGCDFPQKSRDGLNN